MYVVSIPFLSQIIPYITQNLNYGFSERHRYVRIQHVVHSIMTLSINIFCLNNSNITEHLCNIHQIYT